MLQILSDAFSICRSGPGGEEHGFGILRIWASESETGNKLYKSSQVRPSQVIGFKRKPFTPFTASVCNNSNPV
jgi:hypothetical protein